MPEHVIKMREVSKKFGDFTAVDSVTLDIKRGICFGLLGPNGAGKSTLISMIYGAASRQKGQMQVLNFDPQLEARHMKKRMGVVLQENALDEAMNVEENMLMFAQIAQIPPQERKQKVGQLLEFMNLNHKAGANIRSLSGGMQRRLAFVRALLNDPEILILDEPTTGLDPAVRHTIWQKILRLKDQGKTILLTTHYLDEAERLCDELVVMNDGRIQARGRPAELIAQYSPGFMATYNKTPSTLLELKSLTATCQEFELIEESSAYALRAPSLEILIEKSKLANLTPLLLRPCNLEDVFLSLTGRELTDNA